mgnify:CR=1 FL=1
MVYWQWLCEWPWRMIQNTNIILYKIISIFFHFTFILIITISWCCCCCFLFGLFLIDIDTLAVCVVIAIHFYGFQCWFFFLLDNTKISYCCSPGKKIEKMLLFFLSWNQKERWHFFRSCCCFSGIYLSISFFSYCCLPPTEKTKKYQNDTHTHTQRERERWWKNFKFRIF